MSESQGSISKEMSDVLTWIAGHDSTCTERYEGIRQDIVETREAVEKLTRQIVGIKKGLRVEMQRSDAALDVRLGKVEAEQQEANVKRAYFVGAMAGASFVGGLIGPILYNFLSKLLQ